MVVDDDLLPTGPAARYLGVSDETLRRWAKANRVRVTVLPSGHRRFRRSDLDDVVDRREIAEPETAA